MASVWENISENAQLPSLPDIYLRLKQVLDDADFCMADVAEVIGSDPAMTARLLRMINSAYFGLPTEIDTVNRAVSLLGTQEVHDLVLAVSVTQSFAGMSNEVMDMARFWRRSVYCAIAAKELAALCNVLDSERLFVGGLLCDIGHLLIYQHAPTKATQAIELAVAQEAPLYKAERAVLGVDYARVGAELMRQWRLPRTLWEVTEYHIEPGKSDEYALSTCIVHVAAVMAEAADQGADTAAALQHVAPHAWEVTGLSAPVCGDTADRIEAQVAGVAQMIVPSAIAA